MNSLENIFIPGKNPEPLDEKDNETSKDNKQKIKLYLFKNIIILNKFIYSHKQK